MSDDVSTSAYLIIKATRRFGQADPSSGLRPVREIKVVAARQNRPTQLGADEVMLKINIQLPNAAFDPIIPATLVVELQDLVRDVGPITAIAQANEAADTASEGELLTGRPN